VWCLIGASPSAIGQPVYKKIDLPTGNGQQIQAVATAPDGRLWVFAKQQQPGQAASVIMQTSLGSNAFQTVTATVPPQYGFQTKGIYGSRVRTDSFFPQNGTTSSFGPGDIPLIGGANFTDFEWEASLSGFRQICKTYTINRTGGIPALLSGPWFGSDNGAYYIGGDGKTSTLYSRAIGTNGVCDLTTRDTSTIPVIQAWKQADGKFLVERVVHADPINWATTEVGLLSNGVMTMLVSPNASTNPKFLASRCCNLVYDMGTQTGLVSYQDGGGVHAFLFHAGQTQAVYDVGASNIKALALGGKWALIGVSSTTDWSIDQMWEIDTTTGQKWLASDKDSPELKALWGYPLVTLSADGITPEGIVYTGAGSVIQVTIPGVTGFLKPTATLSASSASIVVGDPVTLTWNTTGATEDGGIQIDNGVGFVPASGSKVVYPSETTAFFLSAIGPGGATSATVTVTVMPLSAPPAITSFVAAKSTIVLGDSTPLSWVVIGKVNSVTLTGYGIPAGKFFQASDSYVVSPTLGSTMYTLTAFGPNGSAHASTTVTTTSVAGMPTINAVTTIFSGVTAVVTSTVAPGQIVTLWGNLCNDQPASTQWIPLQTTVANCSVQFTDAQGIATVGNLYYVSAEQINVQVPDSLTTGVTYKMAVTINGLSSAPITLTTVGTNPNYVQQVVDLATFLKPVHNSDGTIVTSANPAVGGETILVFLTGLGKGTQVAININGTPALVYYAGPQGDYPGLDQINVQVPPNIQYATEFSITATAVDGTQKTDILSVEPGLQ
jgi:uncharacterized protein (TIGR03437 family)